MATSESWIAGYISLKQGLLIAADRRTIPSCIREEILNCLHSENKSWTQAVPVLVKDDWTAYRSMQSMSATEAE